MAQTLEAAKYRSVNRELGTFLNLTNPIAFDSAATDSGTATTLEMTSWMPGDSANV
jgi:hypothetical protein